MEGLNNKNKYDLPRDYLSYSAYSLWKKDKNKFRRKYYENEKDFENAETIFGKKIAKALEDGKSIKGVEKTKHPEYKIEAKLEDGLKILGYLDDLDEDTLQIREFKTGHLNAKGKAPWDAVKVRKHKQLVFYCLLVKLKFGKYNPLTILEWMETVFLDEKIEFSGYILTAKTKKLGLTGKVEKFERTIEEWELEKLKDDIILTAKEITEDYKLWKEKK